MLASPGVRRPVRGRRAGVAAGRVRRGARASSAGCSGSRSSSASSGRTASCGPTAPGCCRPTARSRRSATPRSARGTSPRWARQTTTSRTYQPVLFAAPSFEEMVDDLGDVLRHLRRRRTPRRARAGKRPRDRRIRTQAARLLGLGLRRVLGRQRPDHRRVPHVRLRLHAAPPTPGPRRACARRPATCSSRATSASSSRARSTADSPIAAPRARRTATACTTSPGWSTTPAPPSTPPSAGAPGRCGEPWTETRRPRRRCALAQIATYGETVHTFVDRSRYRGRPPRARLLHRRACHRRPSDPPVGLTGIDHVVGNVEQGQLDDWVRLLRGGHGLRPAAALRRRPDLAPSTRRSCRRSCGTAPRSCMPINEPADGREEEPDPGVPRDLRRPGRAAHRPAHRRHRRHGRRAARPRRAVHDACPTPTTTRPAKRARRRRPAVGRAAAPRHPRRPRRTTATCCRSSPRRSPTGRPCSSRSSSASGAQGFGEGNFKALFEAIERDQAAARQPLSARAWHGDPTVRLHLRTCPTASRDRPRGHPARRPRGGPCRRDR